MPKRLVYLLPEQLSCLAALPHSLHLVDEQGRTWLLFYPRLVGQDYVLGIDSKGQKHRFHLSALKEIWYEQHA